jgi:hypothetical protein
MPLSLSLSASLINANAVEKTGRRMGSAVSLTEVLSFLRGGLTLVKHAIWRLLLPFSIWTLMICGLNASLTLEGVVIQWNYVLTTVWHLRTTCDADRASDLIIRSRSKTKGWIVCFKLLWTVLLGDPAFGGYLSRLCIYPGPGPDGPTIRTT